jgi:hypothetical protein
MKTAVATLKSVTPYSQSKHVMADKKDKEGHDAYEKRTWNMRCHVDKDNLVFIPPLAFKNCLAEAAKYLSIQIPGRGKATYTKHFEAGVSVMDPVPLGIKLADIEGEWLFVPADGKRGGTKRVSKCFPYIPEWQADVIFYILDDTVTEQVFAEHLDQAGKFIGIGRFRPRNNGYYGRFEVLNIKWS